MDHRKCSKTALQNAADNSKYVELVRSGEDYFLRLEKLIDKAEKVSLDVNLTYKIPVVTFCSKVNVVHAKL